VLHDVFECDDRKLAEMILATILAIDGERDRREVAVLREIEMGNLGELADAEDDERFYWSTLWSGRLVMEHFQLALTA
jgi:hypothetical protein